MKEFPNWVPSGVVAVYQELDQQMQNVPSFPCKQEDIDALRRCILSTSMERTWKLIQSKSDKCDPEEIAEIIVEANISSRRVYSCPTTSQIAEHKKLSMRVRAISSDFDDLVRFSPLVWVCLESPQKYLDDLAARLDLDAKSAADFRRKLKRYSGKPRSKSGVRTYVIRHLYEQIQERYQQPWHDVVAAIASEILGELVDKESARALFRISQI